MYIITVIKMKDRGGLEDLSTNMWIILKLTLKH